MTIHTEIAELIRGHLRHDHDDLQIAALTAEIKRALESELGWVTAMQENAIRRALVTGRSTTSTIISVTGRSEDDLARIRETPVAR